MFCCFSLNSVNFENYPSLLFFFFILKVSVNSLFVWFFPFFFSLLHFHFSLLFASHSFEMNFIGKLLEYKCQYCNLTWPTYCSGLCFFIRPLSDTFKPNNSICYTYSETNKMNLLICYFIKSSEQMMDG